MKMNMLGTFLVSIALTLVSVDTATTVYPSCSSLDLVSADHQNFIEYSPFKIYRTMQPFYNCSKVIHMKPFGQHTITGILIKRNLSYLYWLNQLNGTMWEAVHCATGAQIFSRGIFGKFDSDSASFCYAVCDNDGIGYKDVTCMGRNSHDEADIQLFLDTSLQGVPGIFNAQQGCYQQPYCDISINE